MVGEPQEGGSNRRELLRRGATGAALAGGLWVAPSIISSERAAAAGTAACDLAVFSWLTLYPRSVANPLFFGWNANASIPPGVPLAPSLGTRIATDGVSVTTSATQTTPLSPGANQLNYTAGSGGSFRTRTGGVPPAASSGEGTWHFTLSQWLGAGGLPVNAGYSSFLKSRMGQGVVGTDNDASVDILLDFSAPVSELTFSILDIDTSGTIGVGASNYRDIVVIEGRNNSGPLVPFTILFQVASGSGGLVAGNGTATLPFYGTGNYLDTANQDLSNVRICFDQPVDEAHVIHRRGRITAPGVTPLGAALCGGQHIGISDMTWCAP